MDKINKLFQDKREDILNNKVFHDRKVKEETIQKYEIAIKTRIERLIDICFTEFDRIRSIVKIISIINDLKTLESIKVEFENLILDIDHCSSNIFAEDEPLIIFPCPYDFGSEIAKEWNDYWLTEMFDNYALRNNKYIDIAGTITGQQGWIKKFDIDFEPII